MSQGLTRNISPYPPFVQWGVYQEPLRSNGYASRDYYRWPGRRYGATDNEWCEWDFYLAAGTYEHEFLYIAEPNAGIVDFKIDGTVIASLDTYWASEVFEALIVTSSIDISTSGLHTARYETNGKNASSSDYYVSLEGTHQLRKTA